MKAHRNVYINILILLLVLGCKEEKAKTGIETVNAEQNAIKKAVSADIINNPPDGMVWIPAGTFMQGAVPQDEMAMKHEKPQHPVTVDGFFMDITEVTNAEFSKFVAETGYVTMAEREIDWEEMKKQLPEGTPKPHDSIMQPGSLLFKKNKIIGS
tara:strand:- start:3906 stop:4370 length:465 start_codon:yes stop_codon:yes gene_type:complete